jgi:platelet-activating factor acetylhydrolase IB subunit beta/gamma
MMIRFTLLLSLASTAVALDYPHNTAEPQKTGWPLTAEERAYIVDKAEYERRPGSESQKHLPPLWPVVPSAGFFGGDSWLKLHEAHVKTVQENKGPVDVLLVGDSITIQWGESWKKHFPDLKAVNIGIGGDKTENVLWRLDHGGVEGLEPKAIVLMIGNNNMFFTPETGVEAAAKGIEMCVKNLREKFPNAPLVLAKILPAHAPGVRFYEDIKLTNAALDALKLESDTKVRVIDLWSDFTNADGSQKKDLFTSDNIHLSPAGYAVYAARLKPLLESMLAGKPLPAQPVKKEASAASAPSSPPAKAAPTASAPKAAAGIVLKSKPALTYPYAPYNEGKMDPQLTGWPLSAEELAWVTKGEYTRKPGHEAQKHLPEMWPLVPTAAHWQAKDGSEANAWIENHATCIEKVQAMKDGIDVALIGDSITQYLGGGFDGVPFNAAWQKYFGAMKTVNLGIGGDRVENVLWRLDHGALDGVSPRVVVLLIGTNNGPLISANGVPVESVASSIQLCVQNIRARCPESQVVLVKILPALVADISRINAALDTRKLDTDPQVHLLDLTCDFAKDDGSLKTALYSDGHLHLSPEGYELLASKLQLVVTAFWKR